MESRILHSLAIIAVCWLVTFALRALPFALFSGRGGSNPQSIEKFGAIISPIIIAGLIIYSYSGLEWRTPWPYLAGMLTVGIHLWKKNPLSSIIAGTLLYMLLLGCAGCTTQSTAYEQDVSHPLIRVTNRGLRFQDRPVTPAEVVNELERLEVPKDITLYVQVDDDYDNQKALWVFKHNYLSRAGYTRAVWIHKRRSESGTSDQISNKLDKRSIPYMRRR